MEHHKKTLIGSIIALILGTSCCWLSSLAIWLGGAAFIGGIAALIESIQWQLIALGVILIGVSIFLYMKNKAASADKMRST